MRRYRDGDTVRVISTRRIIGTARLRIRNPNHVAYGFNGIVDPDDWNVCTYVVAAGIWYGPYKGYHVEKVKD